MLQGRDTWQYFVDGATIAFPFVAILVTVAAYLLSYLRRPKVSIEEDTDRVQSHLEGAGRNIPYIRLLGSNRGWRRAARETQVIVLGYRRAGEPPSKMVSLGSPTLGWTSAEAPNAALTVFPGLSRPFDLGSLFPGHRDDAGRLLTRDLIDPELGRWVEGPPTPTPIADGGKW
jgi:hypothetical protein